MNRGALIFAPAAAAVAAWLATNAGLNGQTAKPTGQAVPVECALVENTTDLIGEIGYYDAECPPDPGGKDWRWIPVVRNDVTYDPRTEIREGPTTDVQPTQVVLTWTKRAKTAQELDDSKQSQIDALSPPIKDALCDQHSRLSVQEGAGTKTQAECDAYLKSFLQ